MVGNPEHPGDILNPGRRGLTYRYREALTPQEVLAGLTTPAAAATGILTACLAAVKNGRFHTGSNGYCFAARRYPHFSTAHFTTEVASRLQLNQVALQMINDHPLLGVGLNNYETVMPRYEANPVIFPGYPVHNLYLLWIGEVGIVGGDVDFEAAGEVAELSGVGLEVFGLGADED